MYAEYILSPPPAAAAMEGGLVKGGTTEEELVLRRQEIQLRIMEIEEANKAREEEQKLKEKEREEDKKAREEDQRLKERELMLKEQELVRQQLKDREQEKRKESLAGLTKYYGDAIKHVLPRMGHDPSDYPAYFSAVENLFALYEVPKQVQSKLLIPLLNERSKTLLAKLDLYCVEWDVKLYYTIPLLRISLTTTRL